MVAPGKLWLIYGFQMYYATYRKSIGPGTRTCKGESIAFRTNVSGKNHKDLESFGGTTVN